jgi:hypothetical protein
VNVTEAVFDPRGDIAPELVTALLAPGRIVRCVAHRSNDTVFAGLVTLLPRFSPFDPFLLSLLDQVARELGGNHGGVFSASQTAPGAIARAHGESASPASGFAAGTFAIQTWNAAAKAAEIFKSECRPGPTEGKRNLSIDHSPLPQQGSN